MQLILIKTKMDGGIILKCLMENGKKLEFLKQEKNNEFKFSPHG